MNDLYKLLVCIRDFLLVVWNDEGLGNKETIRFVGVCWAGTFGRQWVDWEMLYGETLTLKFSRVDFSVAAEILR